MENIRLRAAAIITIALLMIMIFGCSSVASIGDVDDSEKNQVVNNFRDQINYYNDQISKFQVALPLDIPENERASIYARNESTIKEYLAKIAKLENEIDRFLVLSSKDQVNQLNFVGDPKEVSNAYLLVKYADNLENEDMRSSSTSFSGKLRGIVENLWYREVIVQVIGPGSFFREFTIKARGQSPAFNLPVIGEYTALFIFGRETRPITKKVGPNIVYYGPNGETYDYKVTLSAW